MSRTESSFLCDACEREIVGSLSCSESSYLCEVCEREVSANWQELLKVDFSAFHLKRHSNGYLFDGNSSSVGDSVVFVRVKVSFRWSVFSSVVQLCK